MPDAPPRKEHGQDTFQGWLLLHQLPTGPGYLYVQIWRHLPYAGANILRNSGYVLPRSQATLRLTRRTVQEIERSKGNAALCEARFIDGVTDAALQGLFNEARNAAYVVLDAALHKLDGAKRERRRGEGRSKLEKLSQRLHDIGMRDFFLPPAARAYCGFWRSWSMARLQAARPLQRPLLCSPEGVEVTRKDIYLDRIPCAWLIRRFVDKAARFKFAGEKAYRPAADELRFDMKDAEFTMKVSCAPSR